MFASVSYVEYLVVTQFYEKVIISITPQYFPASGLWNVENLTGYESNPVPMQKKFSAEL